jgi:cobalt-zinc-cadmium resistance protein CzcA
VQLAKIEEDHGATLILRERNQRRIAVRANIRGRDLMDAVTDAQNQVAKAVKIPEGYRIVWGGQFARAQSAMMGLLLIIPLTMLLIFALLYAAVGSVRIAALTLLCVPLAIPGAIFALFVTHTHFSISAGVGLIALFGVSCQNGIIFVSLVKQLREEGAPLVDAIRRSAMIKLKPALMASTVATVGLIPAAFSTGIGSQSQRPIAIVIVGGVLPAMILAWMVLPALYEFFEERLGGAAERKSLEALVDDAHP